MAWWRRQQEAADEPEVPPRGRRRVRWLLALGMLSAAVGFGPQVAVLTRLRERPLEVIAERLDGTIASSSASWNWLRPV